MQKGKQIYMHANMHKYTHTLQKKTQACLPTAGVGWL